MLVLWGTGQDSRYDSPETGRLRSSSGGSGKQTTLVPRWKLSGSELWFGATADMVDILTIDESAQAYSDSHIVLDGESARRSVFFKLQAGIWRVSAEFMLDAGGASGQVSRMFRVESDADDTDIADSEPAISDSANCPGPPIFDRNTVIPQTGPFTVAEDDVFYFMLGTAGFGSAIGSHWAGFEYLGTA